MRKLTTCTIVVTFMISLFGCSPAKSDEVTDTVNVAMEKYKKGDLVGSAKDLEYVTQLIRQQRGKALEDLLPQALKGWETAGTNSQSVSTAVLGGGVYAERTFRRGYALVTVKIITDSPMIQSVMMMLTNPLITTASGGMLSRVKGNQALVKYNPQSQAGDINIIVDNKFHNKFLVTASGSYISKEELTEYAENVDYSGLKTL